MSKKISHAARPELAPSLYRTTAPRWPTAALVALAVVATSCASSEAARPAASSVPSGSTASVLPADGSRASYAAAPCPNPIFPEFGTSLDLGPDFRCGYLTVPEDRSKPDGRTIRLAVAIRPADRAGQEA